MLVNLKRLYVQEPLVPAGAAGDRTRCWSCRRRRSQELRDRGLLSYHLHDYASALRDLEEYLRLLTLTDRSDDAREETTQVWDHVKSLRRRVASFN